MSYFINIAAASTLVAFASLCLEVAQRLFRSSKYSSSSSGSWFFLEHGRIILMRPSEMHMLESMGEEPRDSLSFHFDCSLVDSIDPKRQLLEPFFSRPLGMQNVYDHSIVATTEIYTLFRKMRELDQDNDVIASMPAQCSCASSVN